jgi:hypothetical protein
LYITGYRDTNDGRFYVPVILYVGSLRKYLNIHFLVDTGASRTQISWNDAAYYGKPIRLLPKDTTVFTGIAGSVQGYILPESTLSFNTNVGGYDLQVGNLSVMDYLNQDDKPCPPTRSMLGIDTLYQFDILFERDEIFLRTNTY